MVVVGRIDALVSLSELIHVELVLFGLQGLFDDFSFLVLKVLIKNFNHVLVAPHAFYRNDFLPAMLLNDLEIRNFQFLWRRF